jgi:hypothetical protein
VYNQRLVIVVATVATLIEAMLVAFLFPNYTAHSRSSTRIVWRYLRSAVCTAAMSEIFIISRPESGR